MAPLIDNQTINTTDDLLAHLDTAFEDPDPQSTAEWELRALNQGKTDFSAHLAKFQQHAAVLNWPDSAKCTMLIPTLSDELKGMLVTQPK